MSNENRNNRANAGTGSVEEKMIEALGDQLEVSINPRVSLIQNLNSEQKAALEQKFLSLATEVRESIEAKFPTLDNVERYVLRQMIKEANGKLASNLRPGWYVTLQTNAKSLLSSSEELRKFGAKQLTELAEQFDSKEAASLIKKYKHQMDRTTTDEHIIQVCSIFGIKAESTK